MTAKLNFSSEFAFLVKQLQNQPDNPALKQDLVRRLPEMMALAKNNPMDLFRLAQIYSPTSPQYKQMMRQAATMGCTNAMLSMCELLMTTGSSPDLKTAVHYMHKIQRSDDSYIKQHAQELLLNHPQLAREMKGQAKAESYSKMGFFNHSPERQLKEHVDERATITPAF